MHSNLRLMFLVQHLSQRLRLLKNMSLCRMGLMLTIRLRTSKCLKVLREMRQYSCRQSLLKTFLKSKVREHSSLMAQVGLGVLAAMA
jgi:hypothetical protein